MKRHNTAQMIGAFIASRKASNASPAYQDWLRYMLRRLAAAHAHLPTEPEPLEALLAALKGSDQTKYDVWSALRLFYRWAHKRHQVPDATSAIAPPRRRKKLPRTLTADQVDQLLEAHASQPRDLALLLLLMDTGLRIGEVAGMRWSDLVDGGLRVTGKTGDRFVPLSAETHRALMRMYNDNKNSNELWIGRYHRPLTVAGLQRAVHRCLLTIGVNGHPHMLRHTFGRLYIANGGNQFALQRIMGHSSISTTAIYVSMNHQDVQDQHSQFSPLAARRQHLSLVQAADAATS